MKLLLNAGRGLEEVSSSATGSWQSPGGSSGDKGQKHFDLSTSGGQINSLKYKKLCKQT